MEGMWRMHGIKEIKKFITTMTMPLENLAILRGLVTQHILQGDEDNQDNETVSLMQDWQIQKISDLFDFNNSVWSLHYSRFASMSFDDELELYDLLELEDEGEVDQECGHNDIDLDGTTQDILGA